MTQFTNYLEDKLVDHITGDTTYTAPTSIDLALYTSAPGEAGGGTEVASSNGYAREEITFGSSSGGVAANTALIHFAASGGNWGTIVATALVDQSGNILAYKAMSPAIVMNDTDELDFDIGSIQLSVA